MRTWTDRPVLRSLLAAGACAVLLAGCQSLGDADDDAPTPAGATSQPGGDDRAQDGADDPADEGPGEGDEGTDDDGTDEPAGVVVNGPNSITAPTPDEVIDGPDVTVTGEGTAFEATLNYRVLTAGTDDVVAGPDYTMAGANGEIGPYTIELSLEPGEYTVQVWEPDMTGGEGEGTDTGDAFGNLVEVTFTVR